MNNLFFFLNCIVLYWLFFVSVVERATRGVLLHQLVGVPAGHGALQPSEHQPLSLHASDLRLRGFHQGQHPETLRQVPGY